MKVKTVVAVLVTAVTVVNSGLPSDDRTIVIGLRNAKSGARIDVNASTVSVVIMAHDHVAGLLGFNQTDLTVTEGTNVYFEIKRLQLVFECTLNSSISETMNFINFKTFLTLTSLKLKFTQ